MKDRYCEEKSKENCLFVLLYITVQTDVESQIKYFIIRLQLSNLQCNLSKIE